MARDYSNRSNNRGGSRAKTKPRSTTKRKAAPAKKRRSAPKKNTRKKVGGAPKWVWLGCIIFIAITAAAVSYIATRPTGHPGRDFAQVEVPQPEKTAATTKQASADTSQQAAAPQQPDFSFYEMLPDYEVVIPGEMDKIRQRSSSDEAAAPTQQSSESSSKTTATAENYIIQVGAFTTSTDANQLKARVTLLGLQANVVRSATESGKTIYRVRSNVIDSSSRLSELLKRLHDQGIETLVLRRKN